MMEEKAQLEATIAAYDANEKELLKLIESFCASCKQQAKAFIPATESAEAQ
jgi:hypothetical protein